MPKCNEIICVNYPNRKQKWRVCKGTYGREHTHCPPSRSRAATDFEIAEGKQAEALGAEAFAIDKDTHI